MNGCSLFFKPKARADRSSPLIAPGKLSRPKWASPMKPCTAHSLVWNERVGSSVIEIGRRSSSDRIGPDKAHEHAILLAAEGDDVIALGVS